MRRYASSSDSGLATRTAARRGSSGVESQPIGDVAGDERQQQHLDEAGVGERGGDAAPGALAGGQPACRRVPAAA